MDLRSRHSNPGGLRLGRTQIRSLKVRIYSMSSQYYLLAIQGHLVLRYSQPERYLILSYRDLNARPFEPKKTPVGSYQLRISRSG